VPLLLLAGEPGIGNSRLLEAAVQRALAQGWCVLAGGCQRRDGQEPYAPLLQALAQHLQAQTAAGQERELAGCAWLVCLLPELAGRLEPLPAVPLPAEQERRLLLASVARFLANVAGPVGTVLVLDDLQWAGSDALDLLTALVRSAEAGRSQGGQLRVVGSYRDTDVGPTHPLALLLTDLAPARLVWHPRVGPLGTDEAAGRRRCGHKSAARDRGRPALL
jgi:predicted ATPase